MADTVAVSAEGTTRKRTAERVAITHTYVVTEFLPAGDVVGRS